MSATRRLDILAVIGGILAVAAIIVPYVFSRPPDDPLDMGREAALRSMPDNDVRADLALLTAWPFSKDALPKAKKLLDSKDRESDRNDAEYERQRRYYTLSALADAVRKFPDSARLQFRLGTLGEMDGRIAALQKAADLDKANAYPLYALAATYADAGKYDQALQLLSEGNKRPRLDRYQIPFAGSSFSVVDGTLLDHANSAALLPAVLPVRHTARGLSKHAEELRRSGDSQQALAITDQIRRMGWRLIRQEQPSLLDMLVGVAVVQIAEKPEKQMYTATGDKSGLAWIARDEMEIIRLKAGSRAFTDQLMEDFMGRTFRFTAFGTPVAAAGAVASVLTLLSLIWWGVLALRSRNQAASEFHSEATTRAFAFRRLPSMYAAMLIIIVASTLVLVRTSSVGPRAVWMVQGAGALLCALCVIAVMLWASRTYKRRYRQVAESSGKVVPWPWKGYPIADKRERQRRLTGVMGGLVIALAAWAVVLSAYMKTTMNAYPWQFERATAGMYQEETKYVHDLVAGKIKVPEKYIRQIEREQRR